MLRSWADRVSVSVEKLIEPLVMLRRSPPYKLLVALMMPFAIFQRVVLRRCLCRNRLLVENFGEGRGREGRGSSFLSAVKAKFSSEGVGKAVVFLTRHRKPVCGSLSIH